MGLRCKRCGGEEHVKNGLMRGKQRYLCKSCGLNFTDTPARGKPLALKAAAVLLYVSGLSMNRTAKLLGVSTPTIQAWLEPFAAAYAQKPEPEGRAVVIELDEMWHYLKKTRSAKLTGTLAVPRRPGRHPGCGGSGCAGSGHAAGGQDAGGVRSIAPG
jgi:transposase-like protein